MKSVLKTITILLVVVLFVGCHDITTEGVTRITKYPVLTLNGDQFLSILQGSTYNDLEGATAMIGNEDVSEDIRVSGSVDGSKPGVYTISYSITNSDGFSKNINRYVGIISADAAAMDISGSYKRTDGGVFGTVTVVATEYPGLYINNNPGGIADEDEVVVYMFHPTPEEIYAPPQNTSAGTFECDMGTFNNESPREFSWRCVNPGYGPAIRVFTEQF